MSNLDPHFPFADEYLGLHQDRDDIASDPHHQRNWEILCQFMRGEGLDPAVSSWLDVGCGGGELLRLGGSRFRQVAGCNLPNRQANWCKIPYRSNEFDLVTAICVFQQIAPKEQLDLMVEISRVLRPAGIACIVERKPLSAARPGRSLPTTGSVTALLRNSGLTAPRVSYFHNLPEGLCEMVPFVGSMLSRVPAGREYTVSAAKQVPAILKSRAKNGGQLGFSNFFRYGAICAT